MGNTVEGEERRSRMESGGIKRTIMIKKKKMEEINVVFKGETCHGSFDKSASKRRKEGGVGLDEEQSCDTHDAQQRREKLGAVKRRVMLTPSMIQMKNGNKKKTGLAQECGV